MTQQPNKQAIVLQEVLIFMMSPKTCNKLLFYTYYKWRKVLKGIFIKVNFNVNHLSFIMRIMQFTSIGYLSDLKV